VCCVCVCVKGALGIRYRVYYGVRCKVCVRGLVGAVGLRVIQYT